MTSVWLVAFSAGVDAATTLSDAVTEALRGDPRVSAADARRRAAAFDVREAEGGFYPTIDLDSSVGRERSNIKSLRQTGLDDRYLTRSEFGVTLSQMLYDGLFTRNEVERRAALLAAAGSGAGEAREQVAFSAVEFYLDVLRNRHLVKLADDNVNLLADALAKVEQRRREGLGTEADTSQARARLALARSVLTSREGRLREAVTAYRRVVGSLPDALEDMAVPTPRFLASGAVDRDRVRLAITEAINEGLNKNPRLKSAEALVDAADAEARTAESAFLPTVNVEVNVDRNNNLSGIDGVRNSDNVLLVGRWNLFNGGSDTAREKALAERRMAARDEAANARRALEERVGIAVQAKATSEERLPFLEAHVTSADETLKAYEAQFKLGRRTLLDTLNAVNELFTARSNLVSGRYEDILNRYFIEAAKGTLVDSLGIASAQ